MAKQKLMLFKTGGSVVDDPALFDAFIAGVQACPHPLLIVHGGGNEASLLSRKLGLAPRILNGRRITDAETLDVVVMVYAGLLNKKLVARLQAESIQAIGLSGADGNLIRAHQREPLPVDYGYVGDIDTVSLPLLELLLHNQLVPVICAITHDGQGQLLNTNADHIASSIAAALSGQYAIELLYCFDQPGVLLDPEQSESLIPKIDPLSYRDLLAQGVVRNGMIPKLDNGFKALKNGAHAVHLIHPDQLEQFFYGTSKQTTLVG